MKLAALSVDLDEIPCYLDIHGRSDLDVDRSAVYRAAVPRFADLFESLDVPATFFVVGRDLDTSPDNAEAVRALAGAGHEIANHSWTHRYDLVRCSADEQRDEVARTQARLTEVTGATPTGFRAPGYTVDAGLLSVVSAAGFAYDASVFPCPAYYAAKAVAIAAKRVRGARSASVLGSPAVLTAPAVPYRLGDRPWRRGEGLLEVPMSVTPWWTGRAPVIGTSLSLAGRRGGAALVRLLATRPVASIELHGLDLLDPVADGIEPLVALQPDLRRPLAQRVAVLRDGVATLRRRGFRFVTLQELATACHYDRTPA